MVLHGVTRCYTLHTNGAFRHSGPHRGMVRFALAHSGPQREVVCRGTLPDWFDMGTVCFSFFFCIQVPPLAWYGTGTARVRHT